MSGDPNDDDSDGNKRTRLIMRPDVAEAPSTGRASDGAPPRGGAVIGTTRLVGVPQAGNKEGGGLAPGGPAPKMASPAKTQYVRDGAADTGEPVAGWIVVVKGPG